MIYHIQYDVHINIYIYTYIYTYIQTLLYIYTAYSIIDTSVSLRSIHLRVPFFLQKAGAR